MDNLEQNESREYRDSVFLNWLANKIETIYHDKWSDNTLDSHVVIRLKQIADNIEKIYQKGYSDAKYGIPLDYLD